MAFWKNLFQKNKNHIPDELQPENINLANLDSRREALQYLSRLNQKVDLLAERFAHGKINQAQFTELYAFYQSEMLILDQYLENHADSQNWRDVVSEGKSMIIRRRLAAQLVGCSIYSNSSGLPLKTLGQFSVDPALFVPMLHAYQTAAKEIFGAGMRSTAISDGQYLIFMPGHFSTTLALFSAEPTGEQTKKLEQIHKTFELANERELVKRKIIAENLVIPHLHYIN